MNNKEKFIKIFFAKDLVKLNADTIISKKFSKNDKTFLSEVGLPFENNTKGIEFKPFTFLPEFESENKHYYLLGETTTPIVKEKSTESSKIYKMRGAWWNKVELQYLNKDLSTFIFFLGKYNEFEEKCAKNHERVIKDNSQFTLFKHVFREDYQNIQNLFKTEDSVAMSDKNNFWYDILTYFPCSGYGDYLDDMPNFDDLSSSEDTEFLEGLFD